MAHPTNKYERERIAKAKGKKRTRVWAGPDFCEDPIRQQRAHRDTTCMCSNPMCCGNPRRTKGRKCLTIQERKADQ